MATLDLTKTRFGKISTGGEVMYSANDSMATPASLTIWAEDGTEREATRYDSRTYALEVFAHLTENYPMLEAIWELTSEEEEEE